MTDTDDGLKLEVVQFRLEKHHAYRQRRRRAHLYFFGATSEDHAKLWAEGRGHKYVNKSLFFAIKAYLRMNPNITLLSESTLWDKTGLDPNDKMYWDKDKFVFLNSKGFTLRLEVRVID